MDRIVIAIFGFLISLTTCATQAVEYKSAELLESQLPRYPYRINSGMVELVFIVDKTGMPVEVDIVRSSLPEFENLALRAIAKYKYQPATLNSKPVESRMTALIEFDHSRIPNISGFTSPMDAPEGYMSLYNKLKKELAKEEPSEQKATHTLKKLRGLRYKTFFTSVHTELAQYHFAVAFGDKQQRLEPLLNLMMYQNVEWGGNRALDDETKLTIQMGILNLMLDLGHYAEALEKYSEYSKDNAKIITAFSSPIEKIRNIQLSEVVVERKVTLSSRGNSFLPLLKRSFVIELLNGQIDGFELRCGTKYAQFEFKHDAQYKIPERWGRCELQVNGKAGSSASVLQQ